MIRLTYECFSRRFNPHLYNVMFKGFIAKGPVRALPGETGSNEKASKTPQRALGWVTWKGNTAQSCSTERYKPQIQ